MARTFKLGGLEYDLLDVDDFDFDQGAVLKGLTGGMGIFEIQEGINRGDVDAWRGLLLMSVQVKNPTFTMADLGRQKIVDVIGSLLQEAADVPPTEAPATGRRKPSGSPSSSAGAATRDASGVPA